MTYSAKVLRDSVSPNNVRLTSFEVTYPRIIHAEMMTHRTFSRNSASSRAIPVEKMLQKVKDDPFVPIYWGKNKKGMQAEEELVEDLRATAEETWFAARDHAIYRVNQMLALGIHKQITNRLLEPWLWHTVIITATEFENFWGLRCNKDAQPEIRRIAEMMREAYEESLPEHINYGEWHTPLIDMPELFDMQVGGMLWDDICKVSIGRCARVSYLTHDGKRDLRADIELCERLLASGHMSPFEHVATPMTHDDFNREPFCANFRGFVQYRKTIPHEDNFVDAQSDMNRQPSVV